MPDFDRAGSRVDASIRKVIVLRMFVASGTGVNRNRFHHFLRSNLMNLALWIAAGLLAALSLAGGISKTFMSKEKLDAHPASWTPHASVGFVKTLGILELLAAVGLILPAVVDIAPVLVPVTAVCWVLLMVGAMITHGRLGQSRLVLLTASYLVLAVFVAWGRFGPAPFTG
jgi:hypothetical protein